MTERTAYLVFISLVGVGLGLLTVGLLVIGVMLIRRHRRADHR